MTDSIKRLQALIDAQHAALRALVAEVDYCVDDGTFNRDHVEATDAMRAARAAIAAKEG